MNNSRLEQLLKFLEEEPNDPFNIYAIAMEYIKSDKPRAQQLLEKPLKEHPSYIPTYDHAGKRFGETGHKSVAENVYTKGMEESRKAGNNHAFSELQRAYNQLKDEEED